MRPTDFLNPAAVAICLACLTAPQAVRASEAQSSQRLGDAIITLGTQTGADIGLRDQRLANLRVPKIKGARSVDHALALMLRGLPARAQKIGANMWLIVPARPAGLVSGEEPAERKSAPPALQPEPAVGPEIVVTALKRPVGLEALAGSAIVIGGSEFSTKPDGANGEALASRVVGVSSTHFGSGRNKLFIRGIADSAFSGPTQATVGQYLGEARIVYTSPDPDLRLHDLSSIEILEGPQGTIYGAGALGGIVKAIPAAPELDRVLLRTTIGTTFTAGGSQGGEGVFVANVPILRDKAALRANVYGAHEGGYIDDPGNKRIDTNETDILGGRAILAMNLGESWTSEVMGAFQNIDMSDAQYADANEAGLARRKSLPQPFMQRFMLGNLTIRGPVGALRFTGSIGAIKNHARETFDASSQVGQQALYWQDSNTTLLSGEARLEYGGGDGTNAVGGIAFVSNRIRTDRAITVPTPESYDASLRHGLDEFAVFMEASTPIAANLMATLGGRVSIARISGVRDDRAITAATRAEEARARRTEINVGPSAGLVYAIDRNLKVYGRYQQGFRPGGVAVEFGHVTNFDNDRLHTVEVGLRFGRQGSSPLSGHLAVLRSRWSNIQADVVDTIGLPITINIGNGRIDTAEAAVTFAPGRRFAVEAGLIYNSSRLEEPSLRLLEIGYSFSEVGTRGLNTLPNVADFGARLGLSVNGDLGEAWAWDINGAARYNGKSRLGVGGKLDKLQGGYVQTNLVGRLRRENLGFFLSLTNLLNDKSSRFGVGNPFDTELASQYVPQRPRSLSMGVEVDF